MGYDNLSKELGFKTFTELAAKFGVHRTTAKRHLAANGMIAPAWNDEQIAVLKEEWSKGTTARNIANMINKTRNAVIGKAHRLKLEERTTRNQYHPAVMGETAPKKKRVRKPAAKKHVDEVALAAKQTGGRNAPVFYPASLPIADKPPITIMELRLGTCRAPVGHDDSIHRLVTYCGADVFPGKSFCPGHCAMYYAPPKERRSA